MEFIENPYTKDTPVKPFSNSTDASWWQDNNCHKCIKYETESTDEDEAKCKLAFNVDLGFLSGDIPLWVAKEIGCKYDSLYQTCKLSNECRHFNDGTRPF
jgi:hypothetical protein